MLHKSGFVNIIGNPNVGKSTLMNALIGEKLSIVTPKVQTTRHRILGIINSEDYQIVFTDTPGIIKPKYALHNSMMKFVETALTDADCILYVTSIDDTNFDEDIFGKISQSNTPLFIVLNKIDLSSQEVVKAKIDEWQKKFPLSQVIPISALNKFNTEKIVNEILEILPESPPYFPKDELTDKPEKFFISEIIREKIFLYYQKEIPYAVEVDIESYKEEETIIRIMAIIYVERETQKIILIGNKGKALKRVGVESRKDIEKFVGKQVYLEMFVKISKDWRNNKNKLKNFGYNE